MCYDTVLCVDGNVEGSGDGEGGACEGGAFAGAEGGGDGRTSVGGGGAAEKSGGGTGGAFMQEGTARGGGGGNDTVTASVVSVKIPWLLVDEKGGITEEPNQQVRVQLTTVSKEEESATLKAEHSTTATMAVRVPAPPLLHDATVSTALLVGQSKGEGLVALSLSIAGGLRETGKGAPATAIRGIAKAVVSTRTRRYDTTTHLRLRNTHLSNHRSGGVGGSTPPNTKLSDFKQTQMSPSLVGALPRGSRGTVILPVMRPDGRITASVAAWIRVSCAFTLNARSRVVCFAGTLSFY